MRWTHNPLSLLLLGSALALAPSCKSRPSAPIPSHPPAADLAPNDPEPQLDATRFETEPEAALDDYDQKHRAWGRRWHDALVRSCWWFRDKGVPASVLACEPKPE